MTTTMPRVTYATRYDHMIMLVKDAAAFVADGWFVVLKSKYNDLWHDCCYSADVNDEGDESGDDLCWSILYSKLQEYIEARLPSDIIEEINSRVQTMVTHMEVAQASMMDPSDEAAVWDAWDREDAQNAFDEKLAMYMNEY